MNPYDFVRLDWSHPPVRRAFVRHDRLTGWSGQITCRLIAETPLFLPDTSGERSPQRFLRTGRARQAIIPGSSLKGLLRSLVETLGPGCWWLFDGTYEKQTVSYTEKLPPEFRQCSDLDRLCIACRLFGLVQGHAASLLGRVGADDARCTDEVRHQAVYTPPLDTPKPRHRAWYLNPDGRLAGRKFYFHQSGIATLHGEHRTRAGAMLNAYIEPVGIGSVFTFDVPFTSLDETELALLTYALALEDGMRHKIGYAKPAGFGSVRITIERLKRFQWPDRYLNGATEVLEDQALATHLAAARKQATETIAPTTLMDLRRVWAWPPRGEYAYPSQQWFRDHPNAPISATTGQ